MTTDPINLSNGQRREILCRQHALLRKTIESTRGVARNAMASRSSTGELQFAVSVLERELLGHLAEEEKLLEPVLARLDAWGPVRAGLMRAEHAHQRAVLAVL